MNKNNHKHINHDKWETKVWIKDSAFVTFHCLIWCSIGELLWLTIGFFAGLSTLYTLGIALILAFIFGIWLAILPLILKHKMTFSNAFKAVILWEIISISIMEIVMNTSDYLLWWLDAWLTEPIFWYWFIIWFWLWYLAAWPINHILIKKNIKSCHHH